MRYVVLAALFAIAACKDIGLSHLDTGGYTTPAGISTMNSHSPDAAEDKWLKSYYGGSHGWGWDNKPADRPNCDFWSTCNSNPDAPHQNSLGW